MPTQESGLVTRTVPRVTGGVSQKADITRHPSKAQELLNCLPTYSSGLLRRPGSNYFQDLDGDLDMTPPADDVFVHTYGRDSEEKYAVVISDGKLKVVNLIDGTLPSLTSPDGLAYLATNNPNRDLRAITVGDTTFIVNKSITVEADTDESAEDVFEALIWIRFFEYATRYGFTLDGTTYSATTSQTNPFEFTGLNYVLANLVPNGTDYAYLSVSGTLEVGETVTVTETVSGKTSTFAVRDDYEGDNSQAVGILSDFLNIFYNDLTGNIGDLSTTNGGTFGATLIGDQVFIHGTDSTASTWTFTTTSGTGTVTATNDSVRSNTYETSIYDQSILTLRRVDDADFTIQAADSLGAEAIEVFKGEVQTFESLPKVGVDGFKIKVTGSNGSNLDDFYVKFAATKNVWVETLKGGELTTLDASTMPHILVRNGDGSFTFQEAEWEDRLVGDLVTNPFPSFVDHEIQDVFFYKNRLGFVSESNVVMSQAGEYFDFFRKTVTQVVDGDCIDVSMNTPQASAIRWATAHDEGGVVLWTDLGQSIFDGTPLLTPNTASIKDVTAFSCSDAVKPVRLGKNLYFATDRVNVTGLNEFRSSDEGEAVNKNAVDLTLDLPTYIQGAPLLLASTANANAIALVASEDPSIVYVLLQAWQGGENSKLQKAHEAWSKWQFAGDVVGLSILDTRLVAVVKRGAVFVVETMSLAPETLDTTTLHLDCLMDQTTATPSYNVMGNHTTWTLPVDLVDVVDVGSLIVVNKATGAVLTTTRPANNTIRATGDQSAVPVWIGYTFNSEWDWSKLRLIEDAGNGEVVAITDGRLQIRSVLLNYTTTGGFTVSVTKGSRTYEYSPELDSDNESGEMLFPVRSKNTKATITVASETWKPFGFQSFSWDGYLTQKTKRI
jgi:hypothetical protein